MTCPSLLRRGPLADDASPGTAGFPDAVVPADATVPPDAVGRGDGVGTVLLRSVAHARSHLRGDDTLGQFARFVVVGGLSTLLYGLVFIAAEGWGDQVANLIGAVLSTILANELHRRLTFHADGRVSWFTAQWEGGGLAVVGLVATSLSLAGFDALFGEVHALLQIGLVTAVTGAIGAMRFIALRAWVFSTGSSRHD